MPSFRDKEGVQWDVILNVTLLKRLKEHDVDLTTLVNAGDVVEQMFADPILLVDVLFLLCKDQAEKRSITDEDFGRLVGDGDVIDEATECLFGAIAGFFKRRGAAVLAASHKMRELEQEAANQTTEAIEKLTLKDLASLTKASGG